MMGNRHVKNQNHGRVLLYRKGVKAIFMPICDNEALPVMILNSYESLFPNPIQAIDSIVRIFPDQRSDVADTIVSVGAGIVDAFVDFIAWK